VLRCGGYYKGWCSVRELGEGGRGVECWEYNGLEFGGELGWKETRYGGKPDSHESGIGVEIEA